MAGNRRLLALGGTLIAAIIAVIVMRPGNDAPRVAQRPRPAANSRNAVAVDEAPPSDVKLKSLAQERAEPSGQGRDPFRFKPKPAPPPSMPVVTAPRPPAPTDAQGPVFSGAPPGPPPPPAISLKFIGLVQKADGTRIAVLTDGKRPFSGRENEEIEGRYKILKIGNESLEIAYIDGRGRTTLRLSGQ